MEHVSVWLAANHGDVVIKADVSGKNIDDLIRKTGRICQDPYGYIRASRTNQAFLVAIS